MATQFGICQFGVSLFFERENHVMEVSTFNFQVFDDTKDITLSPSSIRFLTSNGFDLNKWYRILSSIFIFFENKLKIKKYINTELYNTFFIVIFF